MKDDMGRRYLTVFGLRVRVTRTPGYFAVAVFKEGREWTDPWTQKSR